jgi:hypothetical protein
VQLSASISRTSRDPEPVLSLTMARAPRELENAVGALLPRTPSPVSMSFQELHKSRQRDARRRK